MQLLVTTEKDWKLLIIVTKNFLFDVYGLLGLTPIMPYSGLYPREKVGYYRIDFGFLTNLNIPQVSTSCKSKVFSSSIAHKS